jgi:hypothetical protein
VGDSSQDESPRQLNYSTANGIHDASRKNIFCDYNDMIYDEKGPKINRIHTVKLALQKLR